MKSIKMIEDYMDLICGNKGEYIWDSITEQLLKTQ